MANTIDSTTEEELMRSIIDGSISGAFEDDTITTVRPYKFYNCTNLTSVNLPNLTRLGFDSANNMGSFFQSCTSLVSVYLPKLPASNFIGQSTFRNCSSLTTVDLSGCTDVAKKASTLPGMFSGCTNLKKLKFYFSSIDQGGNIEVGYTNLEVLVMPNLITANACWCRDGRETIKKIDFGSLTTFTGGNSTSGFFDSSSPLKLEALIFRTNSVVTLSNANLATDGLANDSTKGQSGKNSTYKIYVPQSLISSYQSATNWSAYSTFFEPIEGSEYDGYWADGSPIVPYSTSGMIAYYDIGNADDWNSETKFLNSHVDNDFKVYNCTSQYSDINVNNPPAVPTVFYDHYANCGLGIYFGQTMINISDVITIEFVYASNSSNCGINMFRANNNSAGSQLIGYVSASPNMRNFRHMVVEISELEGFKVYCDKVLKVTNTSVTSILSQNTTLRIVQSNNSYIGYVAVWNRKLTSEEIAQHYDYYVETAHVGETAFDSSGNFIADQS